MTQSYRNPALRRSCVKLPHSYCDSPHSCVVPSAIGCLWGTLPSNGKKLYMAIFIIQVCGLLNQRNCLHLCLTAIFQSTIPHLLQPCKKLWQVERRSPPWWLRWHSVCQQCGRLGFDPWIGKIPGEGNGNPLQYSCLGNPMDRGP